MNFFANLLPEPRRVTLCEGSAPASRPLRILTEGLSEQQAADFSRLTAIVLGARLCDDTPGACVVRVQVRPDYQPEGMPALPESLAAEAYALQVAEEIVLTGRTYAGIQRGIQTLKQLLENGESCGEMPCCAILDWPRLAARGIHFDLARELEYRPEHVQRVVELLAYFKMNTLHLYLENKFVYPSAPEVAPPNVMTPEQARDLCDYARLFGITVIPQIPTMGHMEHFLHGKYAHLREDPETPFNLCPTHPEARPFLAGLIADVADAFRAPFIHVGYDESHSGVCARCQQHGTPQAILADHLNWLDAEVKKHGVRTMIYGDKFLSYDDCPRTDFANGGTAAEARAALAGVNRDILITDWHYNAPYGETCRYFVEAGFETHMVSASNIYWHDAIPLQRGHHWIVEIIDRAVAEGVTGAFNANWEYYRGQFFDNFWFFQGLAAERQWTDRPHEYLTYGRRFSSRFWGVSEDYYSDIASLSEAAPTHRRPFFLDDPLLKDPHWHAWQRKDFSELGDYLIRQVDTLRRLAIRNADTLRLLDMPGQILRYLGERLTATVRLETALKAGSRDDALACLQMIEAAAHQVAARLDDGYRIYGGAVEDRGRLQAHLDELQRYRAIIQQATAEEFQALTLESLYEKGQAVIAIPSVAQ